MKNKIIIIFSSLFLLCFTGCENKELKESDFADIHANMSVKAIERKLGKPDKIENDSNKVRGIDEKEDEESTDSFISKYPDSIITFFKNSKEKKELLSKMEDSNDLYSYEYHYKEDGNSYKWYIYFVDDKVVWMSFP